MSSLIDLVSNDQERQVITDLLSIPSKPKDVHTREMQEVMDRFVDLDEGPVRPSQDLVVAFWVTASDICVTHEIIINDGDAI